MALIGIRESNNGVTLRELYVLFEVLPAAFNSNNYISKLMFLHGAAQLGSLGNLILSICMLCLVHEITLHYRTQELCTLKNLNIIYLMERILLLLFLR